jgi:hypothetical protein
VRAAYQGDEADGRLRLPQLIARSLGVSGLYIDLQVGNLGRIQLGLREQGVGHLRGMGHDGVAVQQSSTYFLLLYLRYMISQTPVCEINRVHQIQVSPVLTLRKHAVRKPIAQRTGH